MATDGPDLHFEWYSDMADQIRDVLKSGGELYELSTHLRATLPEDPPQHIKALVWAVDYHHLRVEEGSRGQADDLYGPLSTWSNGVAYPPILSAVTEDTLLAWKDAIVLFSGLNHALDAQINDMLWCRKLAPRPDTYARAAQMAMRQMWADSSIASVNRSDALVRALTICVELRDEGLISEAVSELSAAAREAIDDSEWIPGVAIPLISALVGLNADRRPPDVGELARLAKDRYRADPFILESIILIEMQLVRGDDDARRRLVREGIDSWRASAALREGIVGLSDLERALELARTEGLTDIANELRLELQSPRSHDELGMQRLGTEMEIPNDVYEGFINSFVNVQNTAEAIGRLALHCPIGPLNDDAQSVRDEMRDFPLVHMIPTTAFNSEGLPAAHISSEDGKFDYAILRRHGMLISMWAGVLTDILRRLCETEHFISEAVRDNVGGQVVDAQTAASVAKALEYFRSGEFEASLLTLVFRIEPIVRDISRALGIPIYQEPSLDGRFVGGYVGLGKLLHLLDGRLPEPQRRYLEVLLVEQSGLNLRNRVAHGLITEVAPGEAALAFHALLILASLGTTEPEEELSE